MMVSSANNRCDQKASAKARLVTCPKPLDPYVSGAREACCHGPERVTVSGYLVGAKDGGSGPPASYLPLLRKIRCARAAGIIEPGRNALRLPRIRAAISAVTAASLIVVSVPPRATASSPSAAISRAEYEACQTREEGAFRIAIEQVTTAALQRGLQGLQFRPIVNDEWRKGGFDEIMSRRVDAAIEELRSETSWKDLITSLASKETAQKLATSAAERVYRSDEIKTAIEGLAAGVGREIGKRIELAAADSAEPALQCLRAFLGPRYGATVAGVVSRDAGKEFVLDPTKNAAGVSAGQVLSEGRDGIAGAVILIVRRQLANLATRVSQRLVGAVLGRLVSVVAGGVGLVLIAKDIWELRNGVLPIIATEMKSAETREKVQDELAKGIAEQITEHVRDVGAKTAERVVEIWQDFRRAHAKVVELAEKNDRFKQFIDTVRPQNLPRLDETVALVLASEGEPAILKRLDDGTLHEAVERLPPAAFEIAREQRSVETAFQWQALAGDQIQSVVDNEIHRRNQPAAFSKLSLQRLLRLSDKLAIQRLASLKLNDREPLFELEDASLVKLARVSTESDLASLSTYLTALDRPARQRLLASVTEVPSRLQAVAPASVRDAILSSRDQAAALGIMLRSDSIFDFITFGNDVTLVREGKVSPWVLWARYPVAIGVLSFLGLLVLAVLWRLIFGRRPRIIVQTPPKA